MDDFKKDIFKDVRRIQEEMDLLFDYFYKIRRSPVLTAKRLWRPPTDVFETENQVVVLVEIAGMKKKDLNVTLTDNVLVIRGDRQEKALAHRTFYRNMEINYGMFERNIYLPESIDPDSVRAEYKDGYLEIRLDKKEGGRSKAKEIKIEIE
ncbi:MAG: Hsp20/alpha crystallin family protein [candidate division Zixibacteria bacterium]|nr:Hsp20/alpha crystallin family protein [candidate division Zixibacteria bacterium]